MDRQQDTHRDGVQVTYRDVPVRDDVSGCEQIDLVCQTLFGDGDQDTAVTILWSHRVQDEPADGIHQGLAGRDDARAYLASQT